MIKWSIITFIVCIILGNAYVYIVKPEHLQPQNQYHENLCKAESFELSNSNKNLAILGSSLGNRINQDSLPANWAKLTFSGLSSLEGLEVVKRSGKNIKYVFIEMNVLSRPQNETFLKDAYPLVFNKLKHTFPAFRVKDQPVSLVYPILAYLCYGTQKRLANFFTKKELLHTTLPQTMFSTTVNKNRNIINSNEQQKENPIFKIQFDNYSKKIPQILIDNQLGFIGEYVNLFEKRDIKIVFYEMPVDNQLRHLPLSIQIREGFYQKFPVNKYDYIIAADTAVFNTSDAIHIIGKSIDDYTRYFMVQATSIISKKVL